MIMGKNTLMKACIAELMTKPEEDDEDYERRMERYADRPHLRLVSDQLVHNIGMIWTNGDLHKIKDILDANSREAPARVGSLAPKDVVVPAGPTGLDPKQTGFFQALSIQTKIVFGQIEMIYPVNIIHEGEKINQSQAALLDKLEIRPFEYKMHIKNYLDEGQIIDAKVLSIPYSILDAFKKGGNNLTALSLGSGYVIPSAAPHLLMNAFKNLACVGIAADYEFEQLDAIKKAAASAPASGGGGGGAPAAGGDAPAKKEEAPKEESEEMDLGGGLFGDDEY